MDSGDVAGKVLEGRSGIVGAMFWMFGLSILMTRARRQPEGRRT